MRRDSRKRTEALDYMQSMLGQLRLMAQKEQCEMLNYFIEMAFLEAGEIIRREGASRSSRDKRDSAA